jgi:hypothetical protein
MTKRFRQREEAFLLVSNQFDMSDHPGWMGAATAAPLLGPNPT